MPDMNGTGPAGQGPMTGRRIGRCTNFGASGRKDDTGNPEKRDEQANENFQGGSFGFGRWRGRGRVGSAGGGRGLRHRHRGNN